jgi:hypothetical protein
MRVEDTLNIQSLIARFANSFDLKDWDGLQACLTATLFTDYSALRGTAPETIRSNEYVNSRRDSLEALKIHHLSGNCEIAYVDLVNATCRVSMVIWRKSDDGELTTHCMYEFKVVKVKSDWKISGITQKILWNEGNASIHSGVKING